MRQNKKRARTLFLLKITLRLEEGLGPDSNPVTQPELTLRTSVIKEGHAMVRGAFGLKNSTRLNCFKNRM